MGELLVDFFEKLSQLDPFDHEVEYVVTFQDGDEGVDDDHYVVRAHEVEAPLDESAPNKT